MIHTSTIPSRRRTTQLLRRLNGDERDRALLDQLLVSVGRNVVIHLPFGCTFGDNIIVDSDTLIGPDCYFADTGAIHIGPGVRIGARVQIFTSFAGLPDTGELGDECSVPVQIGSGAVIGAGSIIGPGVRIGESAVVGLGSVVSVDVPPGSFVSGNPARASTFPV